MARYNPRDVLSSYAALSALNANFEEISNQLEKVVYRDGTAPNSMLAPLDLNHYRIENVADAVNNSDAVNYGQVTAYIATLLNDIEAGSVADLLLRTDLNANGGAGLVKFLQNGSGAVARSVQSKLRDNLHVFDFGVVADGVTDDTAAFQAAVTAAANNGRTLHLMERGVIRLTAPITSTKPVRITGGGVAPYVGALNNGNVRDVGSWLYFDHLGKGLVFDNNSPMSGVQLNGFGVFRNQPLPGPGWTPVDHDYDVYLESVSAELDDLMFLGSTRGIKSTNGNYGRFTATRIFGQFFKEGIRLDKQYDLCMIDQFRSWGFWADHAAVLTYQKANLDAIYLERNDNPMLSNIFTISSRSGIRIGESATDGSYPGGTAAKLKITNADLDIGKYGLWVDNTVTTGCQVDAVNFSAQCDSLPDSNPIFVEGSNCTLSFVNADLRLAGKNAVRVVGGTLSKVRLGGRIFVAGFDADAGGNSAFAAGVNNTLILDSVPDVSGGGVGGSYGGSGKIITPDWRSWSPTITSETGTLGTVTVNRASYRRHNNVVDIDLDFTITSAGTGAGALNVPIPVVADGSGILPGYIAFGAADGLIGVINPGGSSMTVYRKDFTTAISTGFVLRVTGSYRAES